MIATFASWLQTFCSAEDSAGAELRIATREVFQNDLVLDNKCDWTRLQGPWLREADSTLAGEIAGNLLFLPTTDETSSKAWLQVEDGTVLYATSSGRRVGLLGEKSIKWEDGEVWLRM
mmetsp:Transcript_50703/g.94728  ORF Transcript_50703/g.94728 Transcript_50703/m.94728 type:complete len:118 (+) Transcript_50703:55-408(+)